MTIQDRILAAIVGIAALASYITLSGVRKLASSSRRPHAAVIKPEAAPPATRSSVQSPVPAKSPFATLSGKWGGSAALKRGSCQMGIDFEQREQGGYTAYTVMNCIPYLPAQPSLNPSFTVLEGEVKSGVLEMQTTRILGNLAMQKNCAIGELVVTPWTPADDSVIAEWRDTCSGGQMKLQRVK